MWFVLRKPAQLGRLQTLSIYFAVGPQLYKTAEAAVYTSLVYANDTSTVPLGQQASRLTLSASQCCALPAVTNPHDIGLIAVICR